MPCESKESQLSPFIATSSRLLPGLKNMGSRVERRRAILLWILGLKIGIVVGYCKQATSFRWRFEELLACIVRACNSFFAFAMLGVGGLTAWRVRKRGSFLLPAPFAHALELVRNCRENVSCKLTSALCSFHSLCGGLRKICNIEQRTTHWIPR